MLENQNWLTLQERSEKTRLQLFHKIINNDLARPSQYLLIKSLSETRYTRQKTYIYNFNVLMYKKQFQISFFRRTIKDRNKLLPDISNQISIENFKDALA